MLHVEHRSNILLDRVFDTFFTTKPPGQGTGLGLETSLWPCSSTHGLVQLASPPGGGPIVRILLPHSTDTAVNLDADLSAP